MKKVAVILSGCGVLDGAEIHESVLTHLALDRAGAETVWVAPDIPQERVVNHLTGQPVPGETRNVLVEAARIARGRILALSHFEVNSVHALILPGGFGAARNLCDFATAGPNFKILPELVEVLRQARHLGRPIGFICIAPAIAARLFGFEQVEFTIGTDPATAAQLTPSGAQHLNCPVREIIVDRRHKIVSTPAYMLAHRITEAEAGINRLVHAVLELA